MNRRHFFVGAAAATLTPLSLASSGKAQTLHQDGPEWFTNVEVKAHDGRTFRFYDDLLKDKIILVNFFYTGCDALCPLVTENLTRVQEKLSPCVGQDISCIPYRLQPEFDTPEVLADYARSHGVGPGWLSHRKPADIELLRRRLGFVESNPVEDANLEAYRRGASLTCRCTAS